jgi:hypothetical protein
MRERMSYTYANRKRVNDATPKKASAPQPSMDALRTGAAKPTQEQMGRRVDLPGAMRAKMENAFGADLSSVKLYESQAVADAGAKAVTQGSRVAFAPGMLDFSSFGGQALLGHELSHVVSQTRGEVSGGGFLSDHALEARADREGAMAARGEQVAMPTAAMSTASAAPAAGPMQAKKDEKAAAQAAKQNGGAMPAKPAGRAPVPVAGIMGSAKGLAGAAMSSATGGNVLPAKPKGEAPVPVATAMGSLKGLAGGAVTSVMPKKEEGGDDDDEENVYESMLGGVDSLTEQGANLHENVEKVKNAPKDLEEKYEETNRVASALVSGHLPEKKEEPKKTKDEQLKSAVDEAEIPTGLQKFSQGADAANKVTKVLSAGKDTAAKLASVQEAVDTGSHDEVRNATFDTADAALSVGETTSDTISTIAGMQQDAKHAAALSKAKELGVEMTPEKMKQLGLNADTMAKTQKLGTMAERASTASGVFGAARSGVTTFKELANARAASKREKAMGKSLEEMRAREGERSEDDEEMLQAFEQSQTSAGIDKYSSRMKALSAAIQTGANVANVAGAPPGVGTVLSGVSTAVDKWGEMKTDYLTDQFHEDTVDKKIGMKDKIAEFKKRYGSLKLSDEEIQQAILRSEGATSGETDEMFQTITQKRAANLVDKAKEGNADAQAYMNNAKIDYTKKNAKRGTEKSLGLAEEKKYNDSRAWKYDEFGENAAKQKKWEEDTEFMTGGQKAKYFLQQQGQDIRKKFQTGGKKVVEGAKNAWGGLKHLGGKVLGGIKNAGINAINFMVDPETRAKALASAKTGAQKAVKSVGNGLKKFGTGVKQAGINAVNFMVDPETRAAALKKAGDSMKTNFNVVKHAVNKKVQGVTDWYHKGIDQFNVNQASYKQMSGLDRFKWSMKNLPARLMAQTKRGYAGTIERTNKQVNSDEAAKDLQASMAQEAEEKKRKATAGA